MFKSLEGESNYSNTEVLRDKVHSAVSSLSITKSTWTSEEIDKMIDTCFDEILMLYNERSPSEDNIGSPQPSVHQKSNNIEKVYDYVVKSVLHMDTRVTSLEKHMEHAFQIILKLEKMHAHNVSLKLNDFKSMLGDVRDVRQVGEKVEHDTSRDFSLEQHDSQLSLISEIKEQHSVTTEFVEHTSEQELEGPIQFIAELPPYVPIQLKTHSVVESPSSNSKYIENAAKEEIQNGNEQTQLPEKKTSNGQQTSKPKVAEPEVGSNIELTEGVIVLDDTTYVQKYKNPFQLKPKKHQSPANVASCHRQYYMDDKSNTQLPKIRCRMRKKRYISLENSRRELAKLHLPLSDAPDSDKSESYYELQQNFVNSNFNKKSEVTMGLNRRRNFHHVLHTNFVFPHAMLAKPQPVSYFINLSPDAVEAHLELKVKRKVVS